MTFLQCACGTTLLAITDNSPFADPKTIAAHQSQCTQPQHWEAAWAATGQ